jgi:unsaturated rhamnogalacturonyl hydrolase
VVRLVGIGLLMGAATCTCRATFNYYDECDSGISSAECYSTRRAPESEQVAMASAIALQYIDNHPPEEELWDWRSGVLMHGLAELYRVTGDERLRDYYKAWLDHHIEQGYVIVWSDSCPPAITAIALLTEMSTDDYEQVVTDTLDYLDNLAPRTEEGGISHYGTLGNRESVWVDSLFMFGMVLNRWGELADPARLDMHSEQIRIFAEVLQDENGFMRHAENEPEYDESLYWARGNGWVVASLADYLRIRVERQEKDPEVEGVFRNQVDAIIGAQEADTGLWWSIMNRPGEIYLETSASALFAYGLARAYRYGVVGDREREVAQRAMAGVKERIRDAVDGPVVTGVSLATDPWSFEQYASVPLGDDVNYGVGAVILALVETSGLPE